MQILLWAEIQKLRRSSIVCITVFAAILVAVVVLIGGKDNDGSLEGAGWYMTMLQPWATIFALPAVIALLGSYMICREEQDGTINSLRMIPINDTKLTAAKMAITFVYSILLYLLLFILTFIVEAMLHHSDLTSEMVLGSLKAYFLDGIGVFLAISPIIAFISFTKKGYWIGFMLTEIYSFAGLFMSMSNVSKVLYPITAIMTISGYYEASVSQVIMSWISLLFCGGLASIILIGLNKTKISNSTFPPV